MDYWSESAENLLLGTARGEAMTDLDVKKIAEKLDHFS